MANPKIYGDLHQRMGRLQRKSQTDGLNDEEQAVLEQTRDAIADRIMGAGFEALFEFKPPDNRLPDKARLLSTLTCEKCGEQVMETRTRRMQSQTLCIPCFDDWAKRPFVDGH